MWGIQLTSLDSNRVLYALNETKLFTPGSTTKLVTEGTAMGVLGADYRFTTRVYRTGPVSAGVLKGDLVLVARQTNLQRADAAQGHSVRDTVYSGAENRPIRSRPALSWWHCCVHERFSFEPSLLARGYE